MRSASITELFDGGFNFVRRLPKLGGTYEGHKRQRKDTTHLLEETKISIVATPLKTWPKHKSKNAGYGKPRYNMDVPISSTNKLEIPAGATHLAYNTNRVILIDTINHVHDFTHMRGQLRFGRYVLSTDKFHYMDEGEDLKEGTVEVNKARERELPLVVREHPELPKPPKFKMGKPQHGVSKPSEKLGSDALVVDNISSLKLPKPPAKKTPSQPVATGKTPQAKVARAPKAKGGESVCGYIDSLIEEKSRTKQEILDLVLKRFPGRDAKSTMNTIGVRPTHMRAAGRSPKPFKK